MKVRIKECYNNNYWYYCCLGDVYSVEHIADDTLRYCLAEDRSKLILKADCEIIKETVIEGMVRLNYFATEGFSVEINDIDLTRILEDMSGKNIKITIEEL